MLPTAIALTAKGAAILAQIAAEHPTPVSTGVVGDGGACSSSSLSSSPSSSSSSSSSSSLSSSSSSSSSLSSSSSSSSSLSSSSSSSSSSSLPSAPLSLPSSSSSLPSRSMRQQGVGKKEFKRNVYSTLVSDSTWQQGGCVSGGTRESDSTICIAADGRRWDVWAIGDHNRLDTRCYVSDKRRLFQYKYAMSHASCAATLRGMAPLPGASEEYSALFVTIDHHVCDCCQTLHVRPLQRCHCRRVHYCNTVCQRANWPLHRHDCLQPA